jgi:iron complex outermembrane receptor protein
MVRILYRPFSVLLKAFVFILLITNGLSAKGLLDEDNTGRIKGKVVSSEGTAVEGIPVLLKNTKKVAWSAQDGTFEFTNVKTGLQVVAVSLPGYKVITEEVTVEANKTATITIRLDASEKQLSEVEIIGGGNKFARKKTDYVARLPITNLENPQVYSVISKELMNEQVITSFDDALKNAPGVNKLWASTGRSGDGAGYYSLRGFAVQPKVVNGIAGASNGSPDPANIERIEVIKGPSGTLFGSSVVSFGGLINVVTKKPYQGFGAEASYTGGSFGLNRITADINTPLDSTGKALFRVNAAYHYENSWQDAGFRKSLFFAPSISYEVNDRLSFNFNTEIYQSEGTNPEMLFLVRGGALKVFRPQDMGIDFNRSYTSNDITVKSPVVNVNGQINYKLSDQWVSQTNVSISTRQSLGYYSYINVLEGDSTLSRWMSNQNSATTFTDIQQNFIGDFKLGNFRNRVVIGLDFLSNVTKNSDGSYFQFDVVKTNTAGKGITKSAVDAAAVAAGTSAALTKASSNTYSAYISDVFDITANLSAMLSVRFDRFENRMTDFQQNAVSPKFGLTYQIIKDKVSLFANYMNGFQNVNNITQPGGAVTAFKPQQANQIEGGVKTELLNGKLTASVSYYDIYVKNVTRPDDTRTGFTIQDGNIYSKGVEADIVANPLPGLNIVLGYSYNDSKNEKTNPSIIGRRPVGAGPKQLANAWISYKLEQGAVKGLGIGFGGNYASENIVTNTVVTGQFILPEYTVLNASIFLERPSFRIGLKLDNLTDKKYWSGWTTVNPEMPRRLVANVTLRF